jgi:hypothetical protein
VNEKLDRFKKEIAESFDKPCATPVLSGSLDFTQQGKPDGAEIGVEFGNPKVTKDDTVFSTNPVD